MPLKSMDSLRQVGAGWGGWGESTGENLWRTFSRCAILGPLPSLFSAIPGPLKRLPLWFPF
jgi:hypothetical protein